MGTIGQWYRESGPLTPVVLLIAAVNLGVIFDRFYAIDGPGVWPDPKAADEVNDPNSTSCEAAA